MWQLHYSLSPDQWRGRIFYFEWCTVNCPGYAHFKLFRFLLIRKTNYIQAIMTMQYVLCESKIRQRISPVSNRLNLDFLWRRNREYKNMRKKFFFFFLKKRLELNCFFRLNLSTLNFRKRLTEIYWKLDLESENLKLWLIYSLEFIYILWLSIDFESL